MSHEQSTQLFPPTGSEAGVQGFKLFGTAKEGLGLCVVWVRKAEPWARYLDPRVRSVNWDVRVSYKVVSSFTLDTEFTIRDLESLSEAYDFSQAGTVLHGLDLQNDPIFDAVLGWAKGVVTPKAEKKRLTRLSVEVPIVPADASDW